ncbi:EF-P 5-aminopentanol modification-associated protein YfmF [Limosilactobacillus urinaemulieris]|uniref:EF-P 5-aminopentanol modification-associated protein YfmF n=1 Tax=Limosilactobacillus urinaemulieris TaxID=2742600 RepID=UPI0028EEB951|nr:pitrilysin family protein [Limosilactobacillus urinaemulieris]
MDYRLAKGVDLHVIPTKQFKMTHILIDFATPQTTTNATARNLLANLLETSTHLYPTQTALARQMAKLYGAFVSLGVGRVGRLHTVRLRSSFINNHLAQNNLFAQVTELINQVLFHPLIDDGEFDSPTFRLQVNNLASSIKALYDDKQFYANQQLLKLYYPSDSVMRTPSFGKLPDLDYCTPASLVQTYEKMINQDKVDIFVLGNVDPEDVYSAIHQLPFADRNSQLPDTPFYFQQVHEDVVSQEEQQHVSQAKLDLGYHLPIYYRDPLYPAALVFNGLFGGTPYSKLFTNVREKAGLAYYASSRLAPFSGLVNVQTGIQPTDYQTALTMIQEQITELQTGNFTGDLMREVQDALVNQHYAGFDLANNILEHHLVNQLLSLREQTDFANQINQVTKNDVMKVASMIKLQASYLLSGEK